MNLLIQESSYSKKFSPSELPPPFCLEEFHSHPTSGVREAGLKGSRCVAGRFSRTFATLATLIKMHPMIPKLAINEQIFASKIHSRRFRFHRRAFALLTLRIIMHMMIASLTIDLQVITPKRIIFPNRWSRSDLRFSIALYLSSHRTKTINPLALASLRCGVPNRVLFRDTFYVPRASMNKRRYWQGNGALCDWSGRLETGNPFTFALF